MLKHTGLLIIVYFSCMGFASASADRCLKIEESLDRLSCYDKELNRTLEPTVTKGKGDWVVSEDISNIDDSKSVVLYLSSNTNGSCGYKNQKHDLMIRCKENTTSAYFIFGGCFMSDTRGGNRVTYRIDAMKARTKRFGISNDNKALGLWSGGSSIPFVKSLLGRSKLIVRATPFSDSTVSAEYNISGLETAIQPLRKACHW